MEDNHETQGLKYRQIARSALEVGGFTGTRGVLLQYEDKQRSKPTEKLKSSSLAGGLTGGALASITRRRANVFPAVLVWSLLGLAGQGIYNAADSQHTKAENVRLSGDVQAPLWRRIFNSKWSPMKVLTDEEYDVILREKLRAINAQIEIVDEDIRGLSLPQEKE
ncbi:MAG: hypothetical protein M1825_003243 [Sarcosagium campestre]|nr:MAG: hypothetical protein M1825_003243 [Sarcosagium campestre]